MAWNIIPGNGYGQLAAAVNRVDVSAELLHMCHPARSVLHWVVPVVLPTRASVQHGPKESHQKSRLRR